MGHHRSAMLGASAVRSCARATHNAFDCTVTAPPWAPDEVTKQRFDDGLAFEDGVVAALLAAAPPGVAGQPLGAADLRDLDVVGGEAGHVAATMGHIAAGTRLVIGGRLPDDEAGGRTGKPDLLVWAETRADGAHGYHPGDIKHHLFCTAAPAVQVADSEVLVSVPGMPALADSRPRAGVRPRWPEREGDCLQLAHYWRMLQAVGHAAARPFGALMGTDGIAGHYRKLDDPWPMVWVDLDASLFSTYSRSAPKHRAQRSALQRYDHEHGFRVQVAEVARQRTGGDDDPPALVVPFGQDECSGCRWKAVCVDTLPEDDLSRNLGTKLALREYQALALQDVTTLAHLAAASPEALLTDQYISEVIPSPQRKARLVKAVTHADLTLAGLDVRRRRGVAPLVLPDVEYDVDTEWFVNELTYLWGVLRTEGGRSTYVPFVDFSMTDVAGEHALAARFCAWLQDAVAADEAAGRLVGVYQYTSTEAARLRKAADGADRPLPVMTGGAATKAWVDLCALAKRTYESRLGHGLKAMAPALAGFAWRDEAPGGLASQEWAAQAAAGDAQAGQRVLHYNEDDVRATLAVRRAMAADVEVPVAPPA